MLRNVVAFTLAAATVVAGYFTIQRFQSVTVVDASLDDSTTSVTRMYDVRDIENAARAFEARFPPWMGTREFGGGRANEEFPSRGELDDAIVKLVEDMIDVNSWQENGGTGLIYIVAGRLVVDQTTRNQTCITRFLAALHAYANAQDALPPEKSP